MKHQNFDAVEKIFVKCLLQCLNVELWRCYLSYINTIKKEDRKAVQTAYEFAIDHIGLDVASSPIYIDYIQFIKQYKVFFFFIFFYLYLD